ncbi:MAG: hypothetical protein JWO22_2051 [Frankiales bacterium]|nr:hypothetical protein [Frankiales bacterium]
MQQWLDAAANLADSEEGLSREQESDHSRRREAIEHVTSAVRRHVPSEGGTAYRVVVAHRFDWFSDKVAASLRELGLVVTSRLNDGAEALGAAIAEQPDLLVLQDVMVRLPSETVLTEVRRFAPRTVVAVQAEGADRARELRARGAHAPFARNLAPADVACYLADLLAAARFGGLDSEVARVHRG